jgi:hypothetical protein
MSRYSIAEHDHIAHEKGNHEFVRKIDCMADNNGGSNAVLWFDEFLASPLLALRLFELPRMRITN